MAASQKHHYVVYVVDVVVVVVVFIDVGVVVVAVSVIAVQWKIFVRWFKSITPMTFTINKPKKFIIV